MDEKHKTLLLNPENLEKNNLELKRLKFLELLKIAFWFIFCLVIYIVLSIVSHVIINYLGENKLLSIDTARLIVTLLGLLGTILFNLICSDKIQKILRLLLIYDFENTGIKIEILDKIEKGSMFILLKHALFVKNYKWLCFICFWILCLINSVIFSRTIIINAVNKYVPSNIYVPQYASEEQIINVSTTIDFINDGGYTTYIMGEFPNTVTWFNDTSISINNYLLNDYYEYEKIENLTSVSFTSNCINTQKTWQSDNTVNISNIYIDNNLIMNYTNNEFQFNNDTIALSSNGVSMSLLGGMYNSSLSSNRFLLLDIIALRINGTYIKNLNSNHIYGLTINCYTILEYVNTTIFKNGTVIEFNKNNIKNDLWPLSVYGRLVTRNALVRDNLLDKWYIPGPITRSLFVNENDKLTTVFSNDINRLFSKFYASIWNKDSFVQSKSNGVGYKLYIVSKSKLNYYVLIIWIIIWIFIILICFGSIYNILNLEYSTSSLLFYVKKEEINNNSILYFGKNLEIKIK